MSLKTEHYDLCKDRCCVRAVVLNCITVDCTGVPNKVATECI